MADKIKVFAIDDEIIYLKILQRALSGKYETATCSSPGDAVEAAREFDPDIIMLDVYMPDKDGFAVLDEIKADSALRDKIIVFACADDSVDLITKAFDSGAEDYFIKPFKPPLLIRHLDHLCELSGYRKNA